MSKPTHVRNAQSRSPTPVGPPWKLISPTGVRHVLEDGLCVPIGGYECGFVGFLQKPAIEVPCATADHRTPVSDAEHIDDNECSELCEYVCDEARIAAKRKKPITACECEDLIYTRTGVKKALVKEAIDEAIARKLLRIDNMHFLSVS